MRNILSLAFTLSLLFTLQLQSQTPRLFGLTPTGGAQNNDGTLFSISGDGTGFTVNHGFKVDNPGQMLLGQPTWCNGKIYGLAYYGGPKQQGVLFSYDTATNQYNVLFNFSDTLGANPGGTLLLGSDGLLYGTTASYDFFTNPNALGAFFSFNPTTNVYKLLKTINRNNSDLAERGGKIYGIADKDIFSWNIATQTFTTEYTFTAPLQPGLKGALSRSPFDSLLYGGYRNYTNDSFYVYSFNTTTNTIKSVFAVGKTAGTQAVNDMVITGDSTIFYTTTGGSSRYFGSYKLNTGARGNHQYGGYSDLGIAKGPDGNIYCTTAGFRISCYNRTTQLVSTSLTTDSFDNISAGKLMLGPDGRFYGFSSYTGVNGNDYHGFLYSFVAGSSVYKKHFVLNTGTGSRPPANLTNIGTTLYGTTCNAGNHGFGSIFSYSPGTNTYNTLFHFDSLSGASSINGYIGPNYNLVAGQNGLLYGIHNGSARSAACIYSFNPANNQYQVLYRPIAGDSFFLGNTSLVQLANGKLYGTGRVFTQFSVRSTIFSFDPTTLIFTPLAIFPASTESHPVTAAPVQGKNGLLYCVNYSRIFSFNPANNAVSEAFVFNNSTSGQGPLGGLKMGKDSVLYGMASEGGQGGCGTLFKFDTDLDSVIVLYAFGFGASQGCAPYSGSALMASDGNIYGTTEHGGITLGTCSGGVIFKYDPVADTIADLHYFDYQDGYLPQCVLLEMPACTGVVNASITQSGNDSLYATGNGNVQWVNCATELPVNNATSNLFVPTQSGSYKAIISNGACADTTTCANVTVVSVNQGAAYHVSLIPNPNNGRFQIMHNYEGAVTITVTDILGNIVAAYPNAAPVTSVDISHLAAAVYQVQVGNKQQGIKTFKIIKQ